MAECRVRIQKSINNRPYSDIFSHENCIIILDNKYTSKNHSKSCDKNDWEKKQGNQGNQEQIFPRSWHDLIMMRPFACQLVLSRSDTFIVTLIVWSINKSSDSTGDGLIILLQVLGIFQHFKSWWIDEAKLLWIE